MHLTNHCLEAGNGIVNVAVDLACHQAANGHSVHFASSGGGYEPLLKSHMVSHYILNQAQRSPLKVVAAVTRLGKLVQTTRPDIINAHMMTGAILSKTVKLFNPTFKLITTVHNSWQKSSTIMRVGDRVIAVSEAVKADLVSRGIPENKIDVVVNGPLGSPRIGPLLTADVVFESPSIVTVAGLYVRKGLGELIDSVVSLRQRGYALNAYIIGAGPDRELFERQIAQNAASAYIHFLGFRSDPRPYIAQADIFVLASHKDPSPLVIPEARALGIPIIGTSVDGIPQALDYGEAGLIVPPKDATSLATAIAGLLDSPEERRRLGDRAKTNLERFSQHRLYDETIAVYQRSLSN